MPPADQLDVDACPAIESPEFAVRFGRLLRTTRTRAQRSVTDMAAVSAGALTGSRLRQLERGSIPVDESLVADVCLLYAADLGEILPARQPVKIDRARLCGTRTSVGFPPDDPTALL